MTDLTRTEQYGVVAAVGFGTGFLWSALAGKADLSKASGWKDAFIGAAGSSLNSLALHGIVDGATGDLDLAMKVTSVWWGAQSAASLLNSMGHLAGWEEEPAFQAFSVPLNFAAAPGFSSYGLLHAAIGQMHHPGDVGFFGGMIAFDHDLCFMAPFNTGAVGHCYKVADRGTAKHEMGHMVQLSIMGDLGYLSVLVLDAAFQSPYLWMLGPGGFTTEPWANRYQKTYKLGDQKLSID